MMNKILLVILVVILAGCQTTKPNVVYETRTVVIEVPESLLRCPQIQKKDIPDYNNLTDQQVADFIKKYDLYLKTCGINMNKIREYIKAAKENLNQ